VGKLSRGRVFLAHGHKLSRWRFIVGWQVRHGAKGRIALGGIAPGVGATNRGGGVDGGSRQSGGISGGLNTGTRNLRGDAGRTLRLWGLVAHIQGLSDCRTLGGSVL
jgi:hypothetical protein